MAIAVENDVEAHALLRGAHEIGYRFPEGFGGFSARVRYAGAGETAEGSVVVRAPRDVTLDLAAGETAQGWVRQEIASVAGHRWFSRYEESDGRYALGFGGDDDRVLGRLIVFSDDPYASSYRIRDGRIAQVNRQMGPVRFSITIQDHRTFADGRVVPTAFAVSFWNVAGGTLTRSDAYTDRYAEIDGVMLPASRRVVSATSDGLVGRQVVLTGHALLAAEEGGATGAATDAERRGHR